ncbi:D-alanyl-D-alanine carboxypeptidase [Candidatus Kuenenbacteria bacterium]|nr:D-alanyl-D-alanine carboxypeptidase [Candidatus Kuenenbacteria bacterium]
MDCEKSKIIILKSLAIFLAIIFFWQLINLFTPLESPATYSKDKIYNSILHRKNETNIQSLSKLSILIKQVEKEKNEIIIKEPIRINKQNLEIETMAPNGIVMDLKTEKILWQKNSQEKKNIASLTKLVSALVFLETNPDWEKKIKIIKEDEIGGARLNVNFKEEIKIKDLFYAGLIGSKNNAILALVRSTGLNKENFVKKMNEKIQKMGFKNTHFTNPTGLNSNNLSTAFEMAKIAKRAFENQEIKKILVINNYNFYTFLGEKKIREIIVKNTNELLESELKIKAGKTGFSNEANGCLVIQAENEKGNEIISVLLGNKTKEINFKEMEILVKWIFQNYEWTDGMQN